MENDGESKCANCFYFIDHTKLDVMEMNLIGPSKDQKSGGECHRYPPSGSWDSGPLFSKPASFFPAVNWHDWCGEFRLMNEKEQAERERLYEQQERWREMKKQRAKEHAQKSEGPR